MSDQDENLENWHFDQWKILYKKDPQLFEQTRHELFAQLVNKAPDHQQDRLKGLLFTMEGEKRRSQTIASEQARYLALMMDNLAELNERLLSLMSSQETQKTPKSSSAKILSFKKDKNAE